MTRLIQSESAPIRESAVPLPAKHALSNQFKVIQTISNQENVKNTFCAWSFFPVPRSALHTTCTKLHLLASTCREKNARGIANRQSRIKPPAHRRRPPSHRRQTSSRMVKDGQTSSRVVFPANALRVPSRSLPVHYRSRTCISPNVHAAPYRSYRSNPPGLPSSSPAGPELWREGRSSIRLLSKFRVRQPGPIRTIPNQSELV